MDPDLSALAALVLAGAFVLGAGFGVAASISRFCTMGAIADVVTFGDAGRLRLWLWAVLVALLGTQALQQFAGLDLSAAAPLLPSLPWLSLLLGGATFGFGMVLASGCPSRALVRAGEGNLKALIVLVIVGLVAQMSLRGIFSVPRVELFEPVRLVLAGPPDLPSLLARGGDVPLDVARWAVCALIALPALAWLARDKTFLRPAPVLGGLAIGVVVAAGWYLTGRVGHLAEHAQTLEPAWLATQSRRPESLSFVAPTAHLLDLLTLWSDSNSRLSFGVATMLGVLTGSAATAVARREFRVELFRDAGDLGRHALGAALMGIGGVTALGCSIGQGVSGVSTLSVASLLAVAGISLGAVAALRYLTWRIERDA